MIPLLIIYTLRKFKSGQSILEKLLKFKKHIKKAIAVLCLLIFTSNYEYNPIVPQDLTNSKKQSFQKVFEKHNQHDKNHCQ